LAQSQDSPPAGALRARAWHRYAAKSAPPLGPRCKSRDSLVPVSYPCLAPVRPKELAPADLRPEELRLAELGAARLASHGERRAERGPTGRTAAQHLAAALQALLGHLRFELVAPPQRRAAAQAERD